MEKIYHSRTNISEDVLLLIARVSMLAKQLNGLTLVHSRQLHIYRNGKKVLVLAGKAAPKIIREDKLCERVKR